MARKNGYSEAVWAKVRDAFERGASVLDLEAMGPKRKAIYARAKAEGWDTANRNGNGRNGRPRKQGNRKQGGKQEGRNKRAEAVSEEPRQPGQRWTDHERTEALKVYVECASVVRTAKMTGVPARTLYRWIAEDPLWRDVAEGSVRVCARMLDDRAEAITLNLIRLAESSDPKAAAAGTKGLETLQKLLSFNHGGPTDRVEGALAPEEWRRGRKKPL